MDKTYLENIIPDGEEETFGAETDEQLIVEAETALQSADDSGILKLAKGPYAKQASDIEQLLLNANKAFVDVLQRISNKMKKSRAPNDDINNRLRDVLMKVKAAHEVTTKNIEILRGKK